MFNNKTLGDWFKNELRSISNFKEFVFANEISELDGFINEMIEHALNRIRTEGGYTDEKINEIIRETGVNIPYLQEV
jgi:hypothetical protein